MHGIQACELRHNGRSLALDSHAAGIVDDVIGAVPVYIVGDIGDGLSGEVHHVIVPAKICLSPDVLHMGQGILFAARCQDHRVDCGIGEVVRTHLEIDLGIVAAVGQGILRRTGGAAACHRAEGSAASLSVHDLITVRSILQDIVGVGAAGKEDVLSGHVLCGQGRLAGRHGNGGCGLVRDLGQAFQSGRIFHKDGIGNAQDPGAGCVTCGIAFVVGACRHVLVVGLYGGCSNGVHAAYAFRRIELVVGDVHKNIDRLLFLPGGDKRLHGILKGRCLGAYFLLRSYRRCQNGLCGRKSFLHLLPGILRIVFFL